MAARPPDQSAPAESRRGPLIGLGLLLLLIAGGYFLARELRGSAQVQDCVLSGRTHCAPIDTSGSGPDGRGPN